MWVRVWVGGDGELLQRQQCQMPDWGCRQRGGLTLVAPAGTMAAGPQWCYLFDNGLSVLSPSMPRRLYTLVFAAAHPQENLAEADAARHASWDRVV